MLPLSHINNAWKYDPCNMQDLIFLILTKQKQQKQQKQQNLSFMTFNALHSPLLERVVRFISESLAFPQGLMLVEVVMAEMMMMMAGIV